MLPLLSRASSVNMAVSLGSKHKPAAKGSEPSTNCQEHIIRFPGNSIEAFRNIGLLVGAVTFQSPSMLHAPDVIVLVFLFVLVFDSLRIPLYLNYYFRSLFWNINFCEVFYVCAILTKKCSKSLHTLKRSLPPLSFCVPL